MKAFMPLEKYILKERCKIGVGVFVSADESRAIHESSRRKNVESENQWLDVDVPDIDRYLKAELPLERQNDFIRKSLRTPDFLIMLFYAQAKNILDEMIPESKRHDELMNEFLRRKDEFCEDKYQKIMKLQSGIELFNLIKEKCLDHSPAKSSGLLYRAGIKGAVFDDRGDTRILIYNAADDIIINEIKSQKMNDCITRL